MESDEKLFLHHHAESRGRIWAQSGRRRTILEFNVHYANLVMSMNIFARASNHLKTTNPFYHKLMKGAVASFILFLFSFALNIVSIISELDSSRGLSVLLCAIFLFSGIMFFAAMWARVLYSIARKILNSRAEK